MNVYIFVQILIIVFFIIIAENKCDNCHCCVLRTFHISFSVLGIFAVRYAELWWNNLSNDVSAIVFFEETYGIMHCSSVNCILAADQYSRLTNSLHVVRIPVFVQYLAVEF